MIKFDSFHYIYPPRPHNAIPPDDLEFWDKSNSLTAQLKINGSNTLVFTNGDILKVMGRHNQVLSNFQITKDQIIDSLYKPLGINGKWLVLNGETLNKSKKDEVGETFNQKFVLFDILVFNSEYLVGQTFSERINLLDNLYGEKNSDKEYLYGISEDIYRVKSYESNFKSLYDKYTEVDFIEGLVMKKKNAKLEVAAGEKNNWRSQIKCRKPEKNYKY